TPPRHRSESSRRTFRVRTCKQFGINAACPKKSPAMPADVRKAFGFPPRLSSGFWATPNLLGRSPKFIVHRNGSAQRFRTSDGRAANVNHFFGKANRSSFGPESVVRILDLI